MSDGNLIDLWNSRQVEERKRFDEEKDIKIRKLNLKEEEIALEREKFKHQKEQENAMLKLQEERFVLEKQERQVQLETQRKLVELLLTKLN